MDLTFIEQAAETISKWQVNFQTGTIAWFVLVLISSLQQQQQQQAEQVGGSTDGKEVTTTKKSISSKGALVKSISIVVLILLTPHMLKPHRHRHPILRRSLISHQSASVTSGADSSVNTSEQANSITRQELVFSVDNMTCGGCGSHVRNLVEANLNKQQHLQASSMTIDKVIVDWRAGVLSVYGYGDNLSELVDQSVIIDMLKEEGYPTSFLYVN